METNLPSELTTPIQAEDPRMGMPSASALERLALCPGSFNLERMLPPAPEDPDAASGTKIHAALAGSTEALAALDDIEQETYERSFSLVEKILAKTLPPNQKPNVYAELREVLCHEGRPIMSGKVDLLVVTPYNGTVIDFKTGRGEHTEAPSNLQLRSQAVIMAEIFNLRYVAVALAQPWESMNPTVAIYNQEDLSKAKIEIVWIITRALEPDAPRIPGNKQCRFCRAKTSCPEALKWMESVSCIVREDVGMLSPAELSYVLERAKLAKIIIKEIEARAKEIKKVSPELLPDWRLKPGKERRQLTNVAEAFRLLHEGVQLEPEEFLGCCDVGWGDLETAVKAKTGLSLAKTKDKINLLLKPVIEKKQDEPSLEKVGEE
jgi:Protein of unknown function (DUF2800)